MVRIGNQEESVAAKLSGGDAQARAEFLDLLSVALSEAHPGFADLLAIADQQALCIPAYALERISTLMKEEASSHLRQHDLGAIARKPTRSTVHRSGGTRTEHKATTIRTRLYSSG
jgi:hypothetical protein